MARTHQSKKHGRGTLIGIRLQKQALELLDSYAEHHMTHRTGATRQLILNGLLQWKDKNH